MVQGEWGGEKFEISNKKIRSIESFTVKGGIKEKSDTEKKENKISGDILRTVEVVYTAALSAGLDPAEELAKWQSLCGLSETLCVGYEIIGADTMMLLSVKPSDEVINSKGKIVSAVITLNFVEVESPKSDKKITVTIAGKDITKDIAIEQCIYDMYAEGHADVLELRVSDPYQQWGDWNNQDPLIDKEITVVSGAVKTGAMFINSVLPVGGTYRITALSTPKSIMNETSKSWENVSLEELAQEIAGNHGLAFESFGIKNIKREYVRQHSESDAVFLQRRCKLEGAGWLVFDKKLILFDENTMENTAPQKEIDASVDTVVFSYNDNNDSRIEMLKITNGDISGTYTDTESGTGIIRKKRIDEKMKDDAVANAIAQSLCREENKHCAEGEIYSDIQTELAAGSTVKIVQDSVPDWNCAAFIYHIRHNMRLNKSTIYLRKPLSY